MTKSPIWFAYKNSNQLGDVFKKFWPSNTTWTLTLKLKESFVKFQRKRNINSFSKLISTHFADHHPSKRRTCFWQTFENDKLLCWQSFQQLHSAQCRKIWLNKLNFITKMVYRLPFFETWTHFSFTCCNDREVCQNL